MSASLEVALAASIALGFVSAPAFAQETEPVAEREMATGDALVGDEGAIVVDPVTGRRYRETRPAGPLRRGAWAVGRHWPLVIGGAGAVGALVVLALSYRKRSKR